MHDLHQAMVRDSSGALKGLVQNFVAEADPAQRRSIMVSIIFQWTGIENVPSTWNGWNEYVIPKVDAFEKFTGMRFQRRASDGLLNRNAYTTGLYDRAFDLMTNMVYAQMMAQTHLKDLFSLITYTSDGAGSTLRANLAGVTAEINLRLDTDPVAGKALLREFTATLLGYTEISTRDYWAYRNVFAGRSDELADIVDQASDRVMSIGTAGNDGISAADWRSVFMRGGAGNDTLLGGSGSDILLGEAGDDQLAGRAGEDIFDGGAGNDYLSGGEGNDFYLFERGAGQDTIYDYDTASTNVDRIIMGAGIAPSDILLSRDFNHLYLAISGTNDKLTIEYYFNDLNSTSGDPYRIEEIEFSDGVVRKFEDLFPDLNLSGTVSADTLYALDGNDVLNGLDGNDTLYAGRGNDSLSGGAGNDVVNGEVGDDYLDGGTGHDQIRGAAGNDTLDGGTGNDNLQGGAGNDTYQFGRGSGQDIIQEGLEYDAAAESADTIKFNSDVAPDDVTVTRDTTSLYFSINGTTDRIIVSQWFSGSYYFGKDATKVERVEFSDGTVWSVEDLKAKTNISTAGQDFLDGDAANDIIDGLAGDDRIWGYAGNDTVFGGDGNDNVEGGDGDDVLSGDSGQDYLYGGAGHDLVSGGADSDRLYGNAGNDTLDGGSGDDELQGDAGNDVYLFGRGDGKDRISAFGLTSSDIDTIRFDATVSPADIYVTRDAEYLYLGIKDTEDQIRISWWFGAASPPIDRFEFADGTVWGPEDVNALLPTATEGNDYVTGTGSNDFIPGLGGNDQLFGLAGSDTLDGGIGNDTLIGGIGNDLYLFNRGDGSDTIEDYDTTTGNIDTIRFGEGITANDVRGSRVQYGDYLDLNIEGTSDRLRLTHWMSMSNPNYKIEKIEFADGTVWGIQELIASTLIPTGNADYLVGASASESISGLGGNDTIEGWDGNDTLDGGTGNDLLQGGRGNDIYLFKRGDGSDTVLDINGAVGDTTVIRFSADIGTNDVAVTRNRTDLYLSIKDTLEKVTVQYWFSGSGQVTPPLEVQFEDGTVWGVQDLIAACLVPTESADFVGGASGNDVVYGLGGNDILDGGAGNDTLDGGAGNDTLEAGVGDDVLNGGTGNDVLWGAAGNDIYHFRRGDGSDSISDFASYDLSTSGIDTVRFANDISTTDVIVSRDQSTLYLTLKDTSDRLAISGWFNSDFTKIEYIEFADGTVWGVQDLIAACLVPTENADYIGGGSGNDSLSGLDGNDTLAGGTGNDTLDGGTGNDTLEGSIGSDVYLFKRGDGSDTINDNDYMSTAGNTDVIRFATGITENDVKVSRDQYHLYINIKDSLDKVKIAAWFSSDAYKLERLEFADGTVWNQSQILERLGQTVTGSSGNDVLAGGPGSDTLTGGDGGDVLTGHAGDDILDGGAGVDTLNGGLGDDVYVVDNIGDAIVENAGEGVDTVKSDVSYTLASNVENLTLTGAAALDGTGNILANVIIGNNANNILDGGLGADTLIGGSGNDTYIVDDVDDRVTENANAGTDLVRSSISYILDANLEDMTLIGEAAINGTGNILNNKITGNGADNALDGGQGVDTMKGGGGNDTYIVDSTGDVVTENASEGIDTVQSSITHLLANNVENLTLIGSGAINGTGNALDNTIVGNGANNTLDGGIGNDTLAGGEGNETYVVDSVADVVVENAGEGVDLVISTVTHTLNANVENLTLSGTLAINGAGNGLDNVINGNSTDNFIDGGGGADTLSGGAGDDIYVVDHGGDTVEEQANQGTDLVQSNVSYALGANLENLALTGSMALDGTGNYLANVISGNSGDNVIDGGLDADTMAGGNGNDTYVVDQTGDVISENANEGIDLVKANVSYTLGGNLENLTLTGAAAINGTGNSLDNILTGNAATNILKGGIGNDTYHVSTGDTVTENASEGTDTVVADISWTLGTNLENLTLSGSDVINGTGNTLNNAITGNSAANILNGGAGADAMSGGAGDDTYVVDNAGDAVTENIDEGIDRVQSSVTYILSDSIEALFLTGSGAINGTGNAGNNLVMGNGANNSLNGGTGIDILQGGAGADRLTDTADNNLLDGGAGIDTIAGGAGNDFFIGNLGNDTITVGEGADVIAYNRGDGQDIVMSSTGNDNTLSLGKGILYADLLFKKSANDLILATGKNEQITFKDWYASVNNQSVAALQIVIEGTTDYNATSTNQLNNKKIEQFDFDGLVTKFDQARTANPKLTSWALSSSLLEFYLNSSDTAAIGGDLAYQYAQNGNLSNLSMTPAQALLSSTQFGTTSQNLQSVNSLQNSSPRLM